MSEGDAIMSHLQSKTSRSISTEKYSRPAMRQNTKVVELGCTVNMAFHDSDAVTGSPGVLGDHQGPGGPWGSPGIPGYPWVPKAPGT